MIDTNKYFTHPLLSITQDKVVELQAEVKRLREAIADIATNMEAADESYMSGFIEDLRKVIE
jgi:uncharacterized protein YlxW (UPF0749 family)